MFINVQWCTLTVSFQRFALNCCLSSWNGFVLWIMIDFNKLLIERKNKGSFSVYWLMKYMYCRGLEYPIYGGLSIDNSSVNKKAEVFFLFSTIIYKYISLELKYCNRLSWCSFCTYTAVKWVFKVHIVCVAHIFSKITHGKVRKVIHSMQWHKIYASLVLEKKKHLFFNFSLNLTKSFRFENWPIWLQCLCFVK